MNTPDKIILSQAESFRGFFYFDYFFFCADKLLTENSIPASAKEYWRTRDTGIQIESLI